MHIRSGYNPGKNSPRVAKIMRRGSRTSNKAVEPLPSPAVSPRYPHQHPSTWPILRLVASSARPWVEKLPSKPPDWAVDMWNMWAEHHNPQNDFQWFAWNLMNLTTGEKLQLLVQNRETLHVKVLQTLPEPENISQICSPLKGLWLTSDKGF